MGLVRVEHCAGVIRHFSLLLIRSRQQYPRVAGIANDATVLLREEEEGLVSAVIKMRQENRSTDCVAEVVVPKYWRRRVDCRVGAALAEIVVCIQIVITKELVSRSMDLVGTRTSDDVDLTGSASILSAVEATQHLEFGNGINRRIVDQGKVGSAIYVVRSINCPVVGAISGAVDREADGVGLAGRIRCTDIELIAAAVADARHERDHLFIVAIVEGKLSDFSAADQAGRRCG